MRQFAARLQGTGDAASLHKLAHVTAPSPSGVWAFFLLVSVLILYLLPTAFLNLSSAKC